MCLTDPPLLSLFAAPVCTPSPPHLPPPLWTPLGMGQRLARLHLSARWCGWRRARVRRAAARS